MNPVDPPTLPAILCSREEEEELINLLQQEELEAKRRAEDEARIARAEAMKREMVRANEYQMRLKVRSGA